MEPTTNQIIVNFILSSFACAYILHQLKIFLLKTGEPFSSLSSETREANADQRELQRLIFCIACVWLSSLLFWIEINGDFDNFFRSTKSIIGNAILVVIIFVSLYFTFINGYERYRWGKEVLLSDLPYFLVFESISFAHYCSFPHKDGFELFLFTQFHAAISFVGGTMLLFFARATHYSIRILFILICLVLCMSGKFSILNWKL